MPSLWRPLLTPWALLVLGVPLSLYAGIPVSAGGLIGSLVGVTILIMVICAVSAVPVRRFLRGMAEAGGEARISEDRYTLMGERLVHADGPGGLWRLCGHFHRHGLTLEVRPPDRETPIEMNREYKKQGRAIAARVVEGQPSSEETDPPEAAAVRERLGEETEGSQARSPDTSTTAEEGAEQTRQSRLRIARILALCLVVSLVLHLLFVALRYLLDPADVTTSVLTAVAWIAAAASAVAGALLAAVAWYSSISQPPTKLSMADLYPTALGVSTALGGAVVALALATSLTELALAGSVQPIAAVPLAGGSGGMWLAWRAATSPRWAGKGLASVGLALVCLGGTHFVAETDYVYLGSFLLIGGLITLGMVWTIKNEMM